MKKISDELCPQTRRNHFLLARRAAGEPHRSGQDLKPTQRKTHDQTNDYQHRHDPHLRLDLPGFCGERLAYFPGLSLECEGALE
ncbi:hypothetical protein, partial [uncultured Paracoccus sp.]|uniref:hypothetical protein n=1 Tax=uncultured Paracoccus sp. TaxID=189685 RepID=UPI00261E39AA